MLKISKLYENIFSLISLRGLEYILNFILYPYLLRTIGVDRFGEIAFTQAIIQYFIILIEYGFNMTAPRDIAKNFLDKNKVKEIFSNVLACKLLILIGITTTTIFVYFMLVNIYNNYINVLLFLAMYISVIGNVIFPIWFFQGIQEMRYITLINILSRVIVLILIFLFVKTSDDYIIAAFFQSITIFIAGIFSFIILIKKYKYVFILPNVKVMKVYMKEGWSAFLSTIAINIYTSTNIVLLGVFSNSIIVGYYSTANKIIDCVRGLMNAITQAIYPYISNRLKELKKENSILIKRIRNGYCGLCCFISIFIYFFSEYIIIILFGESYRESVFLLKMMSVIPFIVSISNIYGIQIMMNFGYQKEFSKIIILAAIIDLVMVFPMVFILKAEGIIITSILVEFIVTILTVFFVKKNEVI